MECSVTCNSIRTRGWRRRKTERFYRLENTPHVAWKQMKMNEI